MLVESGISVAPLQRPRAPDAKHMAPASTDIRSRLRRAEPLPQVIEKADNTSSEEDRDAKDGDTDNNNNNRDSENNEDGENDNENDEEDKDKDKNNKNNSEHENNSMNDRDNAPANDKIKDRGLPAILDPVTPCEPSRISGTPARGSAAATAPSVAPTHTHEVNHVGNTPARGSVIPTTTSVASTPTRKGGNTPAQGSVVPTATSVALLAPKMTYATIGKDSGKSTTDVGPFGEGGFILFYFIFAVFIFINLVLSTPPLGPIPDDGIKFYFDLISYFNCFCRC